jgi:purine-nucleoside phosphorylase
VEVLSVKPDPDLTQMLSQSVASPDVNVHKGRVWSTDAVFRETRSAVRTHQQAGVLGVEMELSSLLSVGRYRSVDVAGVLVVSDELSTLNWQPGFKSARFKKGRATALEGIVRCIEKL